MKTTFIILVCLLITSITAQATDTLPQGRWKVTQVTIEKNIDGNLQTAVYNTATAVESYVRCPKEWEINEQTIIQRYPNGREEASILYYVEGDLLTVRTTYEQQYQFSISGENLTLITTYNYVNNLPTGHTERISEKWTVVFKNTQL